MMERIKIFLRKDTLTSENKTEILEKNFNHTKQQKLSFNTSVEKTKLVVDTMVSERRQRRNTSSSSDMDMNGNSQQDIEDNFILDETYHISENSELSNTNEVIEQRGVNNSRYSNTSDACMQSNINLNVSANNCDNYQKSIQQNEKSCLGHGNIDSYSVNEFNGSPVVHLEDCKIEETLVKGHDSSKVRTKSTAKNHNNENENIQKTSSKVKNESRNNNKIKNMKVKCNPVKQESMPKSEANILSNSNLSKIPQHSKNMIKTNAYENDNNKMENNAMFDCNKKMLAREKFIKMNIKANYPCFSLPANKIKVSELKKVTANKSVTDLINYFENLNNIKGSNVIHSNVKSQEKIFECKEIMKLGTAENANRSVKSNALSNVMGTKRMKIGCSNSYKKSPINTTPKAIVAGGDTNKYQSMLSSIDDVRFCTNYMTNCDQIEQIKHRPEHKVIQEHIFIFSDDSREKELPATPTSRCIRTRFTRKMNRPNNIIPFSECYPKDDEKVHLSLTSNKAKEEEIFIKNNINQTAVKIFLNDRGNKLCLNQDLKKRRKHQENFLPQIKCANSTKRISAGKVFIGIFLSATICVVFWKAVAEYNTSF